MSRYESYVSTKQLRGAENVTLLGADDVMLLGESAPSTLSSIKWVGLGTLAFVLGGLATGLWLLGKRR